MTAEPISFSGQGMKLRMSQTSSKNAAERRNFGFIFFSTFGHSRFNDAHRKTASATNVKRSRLALRCSIRPNVVARGSKEMRLERSLPFELSRWFHPRSVAKASKGVKSWPVLLCSAGSRSTVLRGTPRLKRIIQNFQKILGLPGMSTYLAPGELLEILVLVFLGEWPLI